jgi:hypothetical protein
MAEMIRNRQTLLAAFLLVSVGGVARADDAPGGTPPPTQQWGEARESVQTGLATTGDAVLGSPLPLKCLIRNEGVPVTLKGAFAWLLVAQGKEKAFFSQKIPLEVPGDGKLPGAQTVEVALKLAGKQGFPYRKDMVIVEGYATAAPGEDAPAAAGLLETLVPAGKVRIKCMVYLPGAGHPLLLMSNRLDVAVGDPPLDKLTAEARTALADGLIAQFRANEYASMAAHDRSLKLGTGITPDLIAAIADAQQPEFAKMWLATTLIDLRDGRAVDTLLGLLKDGSGGERYVIAYHGPKMKDEKLDAEISRLAQQGKDPLFSAWAARGFATAGQETKSAAVVESLVAALDKPGDEARKNICESLMKVTKQTWAYDPAASDDAKARVIAQWKAWLQQPNKDWSTTR